MLAVVAACADAEGSMDAGEADAGTVCTTCGACEEIVPIDSALHVAGGIDHPDLPPAGGSHDPCWAPWGVHADEVQDENWVHNLEHGGIVFLYRCPEGCADETAELAELVETRGHALLTPYAELPTRFAFVSWGARLSSDCHDLAAARAFYDAHVGRAPEYTVADPPATCP